MSTTAAVDRSANEQIRASWDGVAEGYDRFVTDAHFGVAQELLERVGLRRGQRFLDVAAGSGGLSIPAARAGADVVATDISPRMAGLMEERLTREGLGQVEVRVADGQALDLEDDSFDVAGSLFGVMLFPDLPRGLSELARVTKPGGRVCVGTFGPPPQVEFIATFLAAIKSAVADFAGIPEPARLAFRLADPAVLRQKLVAAGLQDVVVETVVERLEFTSGEQLWDFFRHSNPVGANLLAGLTDEQRTDVRAYVDAFVRERRGPNEVAVLTNAVHIGVGIPG